MYCLVNGAMKIKVVRYFNCGISGASSIIKICVSIPSLLNGEEVVEVVREI